MLAAAAEAQGRAKLAKDCDRRLARMQEDCMQRLKSASCEAETRCCLTSRVHAANFCNRRLPYLLLPATYAHCRAHIAH